MSGAAKDDLRDALPSLGHTLRRFGPHVRRQWALIAGGSAALLAEVVLRLAEPWPLKFIFDRVIQPDPAAAASGIGWADALDPGTLLVASAIAIVVLTALRAGTAYLTTVAFALAGNRVLTAVRSELFRHLQRLSLRFHDTSRTGDLLTRLTSDVGRLQEVTVTAALPLVGNVVTCVGMVVVMAFVSLPLTLVAIVAMPVFLLLVSRRTGQIRTVSRKQRAVEGELAGDAAESLGAIKVVQSYTMEGSVEAAFDQANHRSLADGVKAKRLSAGLERTTDVLVAVSTGGVILVGARLVIAGRLTPGDLIVFMTYLKNAFKPMRDMAKYTGRIAKAAASGERLVDLLDTAPEIVDRPGATVAPRARGDIEFEAVRFAYTAAGAAVLDDVSFAVKAGTRVALVGPSGAGKSSILGLVSRLYDPDSGRILLDGTDIRERTVASVRAQVAVVLQESVLFATTVRENIAYGRPDATAAEIEAAARLAGAHDFVSALPDGYDTVLGERGATLSGGQRQRIAIARAAVRDAPIILLDEPTTGLDVEQERAVLEALARLCAGRTTFVVAHDLDTVVDADGILYLEGGRMVESGTHQALLDRRGAYAAAFAKGGEAIGARAR